jgi:hypothetical protein
MADLPSDFDLRDLQGWIDQAIRALQFAQPKHGASVPVKETIRGHVAFGVAISAAICMSIPEAQLIVVSAERVVNGPIPTQLFGAQIGEVVFYHDRFRPMEDVKQLAVECYRDDLAALNIEHKEIVARCDIIDGESVKNFSNGSWPLFLSNEIGARRLAHRQAHELEKDTPAARRAGPAPRI